MLAGLSKWESCRVPPAFWAIAGSTIVDPSNSPAAATNRCAPRVGLSRPGQAGLMVAIPAIGAVQDQHSEPPMRGQTDPLPTAAANGRSRRDAAVVYRRNRTKLAPGCDSRPPPPCHSAHER